MFPFFAPAPGPSPCSSHACPVSVSEMLSFFPLRPLLQQFPRPGGPSPNLCQHSTHVVSSADAFLPSLRNPCPSLSIPLSSFTFHILCSSYHHPSVSCLFIVCLPSRALVWLLGWIPPNAQNSAWHTVGTDPYLVNESYQNGVIYPLTYKYMGVERHSFRTSSILIHRILGPVKFRQDSLAGRMNSCLGNK